jgi:hypothetical protein
MMKQTSNQISRLAQKFEKTKSIDLIEKSMSSITKPPSKLKNASPDPKSTEKAKKRYALQTSFSRDLCEKEEPIFTAHGQAITLRNAEK